MKTLGGDDTTIDGVYGSARTRKVWRCRIVDASKVPEELLKLDTGECLRRHSEEIDVPGVEFFQVDQLVVR